MHCPAEMKPNRTRPSDTTSSSSRVGSSWARISRAANPSRKTDKQTARGARPRDSVAMENMARVPVRLVGKVTSAIPFTDRISALPSSHRLPARGEPALNAVRRAPLLTVRLSVVLGVAVTAPVRSRRSQEAKPITRTDAPPSPYPTGRIRRKMRRKMQKAADTRFDYDRDVTEQAGPPCEERCHNVAKTGVDSGGLQETEGDDRMAGT